MISARISFINQPATLVVMVLGALLPAAANPTISGSNGMWYLGGVASDNGYFTSQVLTVSPNGATGAIDWYDAGWGAGALA